MWAALAQNTFNDYFQIIIIIIIIYFTYNYSYYFFTLYIPTEQSAC